MLLLSIFINTKAIPVNMTTMEVYLFYGLAGKLLDRIILNRLYSG